MSAPEIDDLVAWPDACRLEQRCRHRAQTRRAVLIPAADPARRYAPLAQDPLAGCDARQAVPGIGVARLTVPECCVPACHSCRLFGSHGSCERAGIQKLRESRSEIVKTAVFVKNSLRLRNAQKQLLPWLTESDRMTSSAERQGRIGMSAARRDRSRTALPRPGRMAAFTAGQAMAPGLRSKRRDCGGRDHRRRLVCRRQAAGSPGQSRGRDRPGGPVRLAVPQAPAASAGSAAGRPAEYLSFLQGGLGFHRARSWICRAASTSRDGAFPSRERPCRLPAARAWPTSLVVFAPGFRQCAHSYSDLLAQWTTAGYVVTAVDFPLTSCTTSSPDEADLASQPADVAYVIRRLLELSSSRGSRLAGPISPGSPAGRAHQPRRDRSVGTLRWRRHNGRDGGRQLLS